MQYRDILYQVDEPVALITMNRPARLNAFTRTMLAEIRHAVAAAERDPRVVGIVLTGAGRGFCAGMDMAALDDIAASASLAGQEDASLAAAPGDATMGADFSIAYTYLLAVRKPVLAAINGPCAGLGFCFAVLSDMRFVERQATFSTTFADRGLVTEHSVS